MPDAFTPQLSLIKPEVGASRDSWGSKINENMDTLDEFVSMAMPVGAMLDYAAPIPPPGWLVCDGRAISRTTYSELFAVIGGWWGVGDGSSTFNLPPASGRAAIGPGTVTDANGVARAYSFAQRVGALSYTIAQANLPIVNFVTDTQGWHGHGGATTWAGSHTHTTDAQGLHIHGVNGGGDHSHTGYTDAQGAHNHNITLPGQGAGTSGGSYSVMSVVFDYANYGTDVQGVHTHAIQTYNSGVHGHDLDPNGYHTHSVSAAGDHGHGINGDGYHNHNVSSGGSGTRLEVVQPVMVVSKIIYAGSQAAPAAATAAVPLVRRLMSAPMRGTH